LVLILKVLSSRGIIVTRLIAIAIAVSISVQTAVAGQCQKIVEVPMGGFGSETLAKKFTARFGPDKRYGAVREDTHLKYVGNFKTKKQCNLPKVYFSSLHYVEPSNLILLESLAGSETQLALWDLDLCKEVWNGKSFGARGQPLWFRKAAVIFRPTCWDCNAKPANEPCACDAALVVNMRADCEFKSSLKESLEITKKEIGVEFKGNRKVIQRFTPQAQLVR
jgi:hypothetical protein